MSKCRFTFIAVLALCLCLAGCKQKAATRESKGIRIAVPSWYEPVRIPALSTAIDQWNRDHPDTPAEVSILFGKRDALLQKVMMGAKRGDFADAVLVRNEWLGLLVADKLIRPFPPDTAALVKGACLPGLLPAVTGEDQLWGLPFDADVFVVWVRRDVLAKNPPRRAGWDTSGMHVFARHMTGLPEVKPRRYGFAFPAARTQNSALVLLNWYLSFGGRFSRDAQGLHLDPDAMVRALEFLKVFIDQKSAPENVVALKQNDVFSGLAGGAYSMTVGGSWERAMLARQSRLSSQIVSYSIPTPSRRPGPCLLGGWSFVLLDRHPKDTPTLLARFIESDVQTAKLQENNLLPVCSTCLTDSWFESDRDGATFKGALERGVALPLSPEAAPLLERIGVLIANVFLGKQTAREAVEAGLTGS